MTTRLLRISVRNLVEFLLRSGDLDNRYGTHTDAEAMQAGSRLHRKIQGRMGSHYQAEVSLKKLVEFEKVTVSVEGRADGIWPDEDVVVIDEIKGTYRDVLQMKAAVPVHLAQVKCYAYIYAEQKELKRIRVRMVYASLDSDETRYFTEDYTLEELKLWFDALMGEYERWVSYDIDWKEMRKTSLQRLDFPYAYRDGQKELAVGVYRTILRKKRLFIQAPTGVGKTLATLYPSLKSMGEDLCDRIFYLTARTITRTVAADTMDLLRQQDMKAKSVILTAKEKMCICEEMECNPDHCPYAKGHFDRVNDAVYDLWTNGPDSCTREVILAQAHKYQVCPFELGLDLAIWMDVIICDYNYVFDPNVYLKRFFAEGVKGEYLFLIDEAHNLVERGRNMYSAQLVKENVLEMRRLLRGKNESVTKALDRCNKQMLALKRECGEGYQLLEQISGIELQLTHLVSALEKFLEKSEQGELKKTVTDFYFDIRNFLGICERLDENYEIYSELREDGTFAVNLYCVRPAENLRLCLDKGISSVFFSATLLPVAYYKDLLTGDQEDYAVYAESPFQTDHRLLLIGSDVSSRYTRRGEKEYQRMARYICQTVRKCRGNYLVFFPSYRMLEEVYHLCMLEHDITCIRQETDMGEESREAFLKEFDTERENSMAAFCVMGGIFSEGIDLTGTRLIGAIVIGTGLPQVCREREILKNYFDRQDMDGFAYAYLYPGMNKVLQAAGRVIRTDEDRGVILLLDERFLNPGYQRLFPREWEQHSVCKIEFLDQKLSEFWEQHQGFLTGE